MQSTFPFHYTPESLATGEGVISAARCGLKRTIYFVASDDRINMVTTISEGSVPTRVLGVVGLFSEQDFASFAAALEAARLYALGGDL